MLLTFSVATIVRTSAAARRAGEHVPGVREPHRVAVDGSRGDYQGVRQLAVHAARLVIGDVQAACAPDALAHGVEDLDVVLVVAADAVLVLLPLRHVDPACAGDVASQVRVAWRGNWRGGGEARKGAGDHGNGELHLDWGGGGAGLLGSSESVGVIESRMRVDTVAVAVAGADSLDRERRERG